ncbi:MAG TPA: protein kinase [Polyangiaceae bacterium]|jgi:serine/threonine-protein kinase
MSIDDKVTAVERGWHTPASSGRGAVHKVERDRAERSGDISLADTLPVSVKLGEVIAGKYRLNSVLGHGGMGVVIAGRDVSLNRNVALKFIIGGGDEEAVTRFLREARIAARLESEYVVKVLDTGRLKSGAPFIVMEYLEGETLADALVRSKTLPTELVVDYVLEACDAIAEAHSLGIIHRDLKPSNIFLSRRADGSDRVKVLDFGISKTLGQTLLTHSAAFLGSPQYVAPEQIEAAKEVDQRADIWALGVILYEALSGRRPFSGKTLSELCSNILAGSAERLDNHGAPVERALSDCVESCLAKRVQDRPATVLELAQALVPFASPRGRAALPRIERVTSRASGDFVGRSGLSQVDDTDDTLPTEQTFGTVDDLPRRRRPLWWAAAGLAISALLVLYGAIRWTKARTRESIVAHEPATEVQQRILTAPPATAPPNRPEPLNVAPFPAQAPRHKPDSVRPASPVVHEHRAAPAVSASALAPTAAPDAGPSRPVAPKPCSAASVTENGVPLSWSPDRKVTFEWARLECDHSHRGGTFTLDRGVDRIRCECPQ